MKRWIVWIAGINILAFGIVLNTKTGLGCAAVSSINYVISRLLPIGFGTASTFLYLVLIGIQLLIVKRFEKGIIAQIPFSILFGWITEIYDQGIQIEPTNFLSQFLVLLIAIALTALGIYLFMKADIVYNPVEGTTKTLADHFGRPVGSVKIVFDLFMICCSLVLGFLFSGQIIGIGIGTVVSAVLCGRIINTYGRIFERSNEYKSIAIKINCASEPYS